MTRVKESWGPGEWDDEPDDLDWEHAGLKCRIRRNGMGSLCGYVGITSRHPLFAVDYGTPCEALRSLLDQRLAEPVGPAPSMPTMLAMLSGETCEALRSLLDQRLAEPVGPAPSMPTMLAMLSGEIAPTPDMAFRCHGGITFASHWRDEGTDTWWFGFDCAHAWDLTPAMRAYGVRIGDDEVYRTIAFVRREVEALAEQIAAVKP